MSGRLPGRQLLLQPHRWASEAGRIDSVQAWWIHVGQLRLLDFCALAARIVRYRRRKCGGLRIQHWAAGKPFLLNKADAIASDLNWWCY